VAALTVIALAGCSTHPKTQLTAAQAAHQRAIQTGHALNIARSQPAKVQAVPQLRLGLLATPADTTGLVAIRLGFIAAKLSPAGVRLSVTAYTSPAAEAAALTDGTLDAAYITPAAAITAWQRTRRGICIIAGATSTATGTPAVVLAARAGYLTAHPTQTTDLIQGHIQALALLTTSPATALPAERAELQSVTHSASSRNINAMLSNYRATADPGQMPAADYRDLFDLTAIELLLKDSGMPPVG
jgi:ABC-type nitrate/sulfonate/bicarbonate transport system substrate-binding protein